ncbi:MAG: metal ABC transporter substrate-binding protein [Mariprofundaceae bacterium]|nr:metal ABC transporter substrate-binding protein [Mariprofundaceae bacterium]
MVAPYQKKIKCFLYSLGFILLNFSLSHTVKAAEIITTLPPLAGLVHWLEPDADVICLLPANADPHHFQLSPRQIEILQQRGLLIRSSRDDGHWPSLQHTRQELDLWAIESKKDNLKIANHAWLNPKAVQIVLPKLAEKLKSIYPKHQAAIEQRLILALEESEKVWQNWQQVSRVEALNKSGVIMQHPSWTNLFQALSIPILSSLESEQHGHEHGPRKLEKALQLLQQRPSIRLIADSNHSNRALQWLQRHHSDSKISMLDALGSCDESWVKLMQRNLEALQR